MNARRVLGIAGLLLASGVVVGASATHALSSVLEPRQLESLHTAVNYQLFNSLGLLAVGILMRTDEARSLRRIAVLLMAGIACFSGGIYIMLAGAPRLLGLVTPAGGVLLIIAWVYFGLTMLRRPGQP
jgi:uncharacterized membrane protein YgdD (TMEM256/DUF423 family)